METEAGGGQLLELLLTGVPDKAIAAKLGVSERTVQRRVGRLMADAGAGNRMQLGRHAARLEHLRQDAEIPADRPNERDLCLLTLLSRNRPRLSYSRSAHAQSSDESSASCSQSARPIGHN